MRPISQQKGRPEGRGSYGPQVREQVRLAYLAGATPREIASDVGCSPRTIRNWASKGGWKDQLQDRRTVMVNLEQQIGRLSKGAMTEGKARRIAMLTRSLERLKRAAPTPAQRPVIRHARASEALNKALADEYGLYSYQRSFLESEDRFRVVVKSRQIGFSYLLALDSLLSAAAGRNQIILSASQDQSDILIDYAIQHASRLGMVIDAQSRSELTLGTAVIRALPANQRTVQGFNGDIILDEFAWHHNPRKIWRAVIPSITAVGGRVTVCSTPFVPGNLFWELVENHKGRFKQFARSQITIHDAIAQGMPLPGGLEELRGLFDAESWAMMYECQWAEDGTAVLSWELLHTLATGDESRLVWDGPVYVGVDVGRTNHRFSICIVAPDKEKYRLLRVIEHRNIPFSEMKALIFDVVRTYHVRRLQIDRTGIGMQLSEEVCDALPGVGVGRTFTHQWKTDVVLNMVKLAEDAKLVLPNDPALLAQLHAVKKHVSGNAIRYDAKADAQGHADAFWALALALEGLAGSGEHCPITVELW